MGIGSRVFDIWRGCFVNQHEEIYFWKFVSNFLKVNKLSDGSFRFILCPLARVKVNDSFCKFREPRLNNCRFMDLIQSFEFQLNFLDSLKLLYMNGKGNDTYISVTISLKSNKARTYLWTLSCWRCSLTTVLLLLMLWYTLQLWE